MKAFDIKRLSLSPNGARLLREVCQMGWGWLPRHNPNRSFLLAYEELVDKGILEPDGETPSGSHRFTLTDQAAKHREGLDVLAMLTIEGSDD